MGTAAIENNARRLRQGEGKCLLAASQATLGNYVYEEIMNRAEEDKRPKQKPIRKTEGSGEIILAQYPNLRTAKIEALIASLSTLLDDGNIEEFNKEPTSLLNFSHMDLRGRNLSKANLSDVSKADLSNTILNGVNLSNAILFKANLEGTHLYEANLINADLNVADLSNANLSNANLSNADLSNANLSDADLSRTNLYRTYFENTKVTNTKFFGTDISRAILKDILEGAISESKEKHDTFAASPVNQSSQPRLQPQKESEPRTQQPISQQSQPQKESAAPIKIPFKKDNERTYSASRPIPKGRSKSSKVLLGIIAAIVPIILLITIVSMYWWHWGIFVRTTQPMIARLSAYSQNLTTAENTPITFTLKGSNENVPVRFSISDNPTDGNLTSFNPKTGEITYTPNAGFSGNDSLGFEVADGHNKTSNIGIVSISVIYRSNTTSTSVSSLLNKGNTLFDLGNYTQAIGFYDKVLAIDPNEGLKGAAKKDTIR